MMLKHSTWDAILSRQGRLPKLARRELEHLQALVDYRQVYKILQQHIPYIDPSLFDQCVQSLSQPYPARARVELGQRLQERLQAYARRNQAVDITTKLWRRSFKAVGRRLSRPAPKRRLVAGGSMIALVGGDGAGKSTAVDELYTWLSKNFDTITIHLGRPRRSWITLVVRGAVRLTRLLGLTADAAAADRTEHAGQTHTFTGYAPLLLALGQARDRNLTYVRARRYVANGGLVICDRFPLAQITKMDGPRIQQMVEPSQLNWVIRRLIQWERAYYQSMTSPELLVVLKVDPEIAVQRKTSEDANSVRIRSHEIWEASWDQTRVRVIDASFSKSEVLAQLKTLVWSSI
jgi:thymidylate kinase